MTGNRKGLLALGLSVALAGGAAAGLGQDFDVDWWTVDGGGSAVGSAGSFELYGTIGQPDANTTAMTGGSFELIGGFWAVPPCWCMSDLNNDGLLNGQDVQVFIDCMIAGGANCACADLYTDGRLDVQDIATFVSDLLAGEECP
ncbi:MAG TPA: hypothetical protein VMV94_00690 [Phycisphaerae bacterium]|nr:hypothetical protein [Phycisphaerae bacterium]